MAYPKDVDAVDRGDLIDRLDACLRLDLRDNHDLAVRLRHRGDVVVVLVVVPVQEPEAPCARRRVTGPGHDVPGLLLALDHRHHDPEGAEIEHARDVIVIVGGDADERDDIGRPRCRHEGSNRLHAPAGVLHVETGEFGSRLSRYAREAGRRELEDHRPEGHAAGPQRTLDRVVLHASTSRTA